MVPSNICYYNISISKDRLPIPDGTVVTYSDLIQARADKTKGKPPEICLNPKDILTDPVGRTNSGWNNWFKALSSVVWGLTGIIPSKHELVLMREITRVLPKEFKLGYIDQDFVLRFLPYLLVGYKFHLGGQYRAESNSIRNCCAFIEKIYPPATGSLTAYSFFCSHRAPQDTHPYSLADDVNLEKAERALNLLLGVFTNTLSKDKDSIMFLTFQQSVSEGMAASLFPEVVVNYIRKHKLHEMVNKIERHWMQVNLLFQSKSGHCCNFVLRPLDQFTSDITNKLSARFGAGWREMNPPHESDDALINVARWQCLPEVQRLMPYFRESASTEFREGLFADLEQCVKVAEHLESVANKDLISRIGESFLLSQAQTPMAKALFETEFYASWGELCARENAVAVGLERDAERFQFSAWNLGYARFAKDSKFPLLYARRNQPEKNDRLHHLNFRQFWR